jgi:hypothetical protein
MIVGRQYGNLVKRRKRNEPGGNIDPGTKRPGYVSMGFERNPPMTLDIKYRIYRPDHKPERFVEPKN